MYADKILKNYFVGPHQVKHVSAYVESGIRRVKITLSNGQVKRPRADGWVDGVTLHNTLEAGQVHASKRTQMEMKAGVRERQTARNEDFIGLVTTRRV